MSIIGIVPGKPMPFHGSEVRVYSIKDIQRLGQSRDVENALSRSTTL